MEKDEETTRPKASTTDILGGASTGAEIDPKWRNYYSRLSRMRDFLREKRGDLVENAKAEQPAFSLHMADAGTDEFDMDLALSMISAEQDALYEIEEAMNRILKGRYGICEMTGKPISPERLDALPWTRFSKEAELELEQRGEVRTTSLGEPDRVTRTGTSKSTGAQGLNTPE